MLKEILQNSYFSLSDFDAEHLFEGSVLGKIKYEISKEYIVMIFVNALLHLERQIDKFFDFDALLVGLGIVDMS